MKVLVGMSGGIDSSVTAWLLKEKGYDVEGVTMTLWRPSSPYPAPISSSSCYCQDKSEDLDRISKIAETIGIKHTVIDCAEVFEREVLDNFCSEYVSGRTPNPCIWCNSRVKFGALIDYASTFIDFDLFATGHYARIVHNEESGRYELRKGLDIKKDQSYFLSRLDQKQLSRTLFPLGDHTKTEIREIDERLGFHEKGAGESQDFYGSDYSELLQLDDKSGDIVLSDGTVVGRHNGYWHYTIGQRKGLGIAYHEPLYVTEIDARNNRVVVATADESTFSLLSAKYPVFVSEEGFDSRIYKVKIRSMDKGTEAMVSGNSSGFSVRFLSPVRGVAPGQSAVVYDGDRVIASGFIA